MNKKGQVVTLTLIAVVGIISAVNIWLFKKPVENTGLFSKIPFVGWIVIILFLLIILKSRK